MSGGFDDFFEQSKTVVRRSAILILATIDARIEKLVDDISFAGCYLQAISSGLPHAPGRFSKFANGQIDLFQAHGLVEIVISVKQIKQG